MLDLWRESFSSQSLKGGSRWFDGPYDGHDYVKPLCTLNAVPAVRTSVTQASYGARPSGAEQTAVEVPAENPEDFGDYIAVKRKKARHAGVASLPAMKNRPMILIGG